MSFVELAAARSLSASQDGTSHRSRSRQRSSAVRASASLKTAKVAGKLSLTTAATYPATSNGNPLPSRRQDSKTMEVRSSIKGQGVSSSSRKSASATSAAGSNLLHRKTTVKDRDAFLSAMSNPHSARQGRRLLEEVAVSRLQRAARLFLLRQMLRPIIPALVLPEFSSSCTVDDTDSVFFSPPTAFESRFRRRLRAELYRWERAEQLRALIAKRVITSALRHWIRRRILQRRNLSLRSRVCATFTDDPLRAAELITALCLLQSSLRTRESSLLVRQRFARLRLRRSVRVIERAWQRAPHYPVFIRHIHDHQAQEMLYRQEAVERRDLQRLHLIFIVHCHQRCFNDPLMWESGLAVRHMLPFTPHEVVSSAGSQISSSEPSPLADTGALKRCLLSGSLSTAEHQASGAPQSRTTVHSGGNSRRLLIGDRACVAPDDGDDNFDVDLALRLCEYRLFFRPEESRLLQEVGGSSSPPITCPNSSPLTRRYTAVDQLRPSQGTSGSATAEYGQVALTGAGIGASGGEGGPPSCAAAFAEAIGALHHPRSFGDSRRRTVEHLQLLRTDTEELRRLLHSQGYLFTAQVAPYLRFGFHCQALACGEADLSGFSATAAMKTCMPLFSVQVACPAHELRQCLVGVGRCSGTSLSTHRPVVLEEQRRTVEAVACAARRTRYQQDAPSQPSTVSLHSLEPKPSLKAVMAVAGLQREGFANAATEALFNAPRECTESSGIADQAGPSTWRSPRLITEAGMKLSHERSHRLALSAIELGSYWREFLLAIRTDEVVSGRLCSSNAAGVSDVSANVSIFSQHASSARFRCGFVSQLVPSLATTYTLRDFMPKRGLRNTKPVSDRATVSSEVVLVPTLAAGPAALPAPLPARSSTIVHPSQWWDSVERLLLQEYIHRSELSSNETAQRHSIRVLQVMSTPCAYAQSTDVEARGDAT